MAAHLSGPPDPAKPSHPGYRLARRTTQSLNETAARYAARGNIEDSTIQAGAFDSATAERSIR